MDDELQEVELTSVYNPIDTYTVLPEQTVSAPAGLPWLLVAALGAALVYVMSNRDDDTEV
jgi:hypothetical protein